MPAYSNRPNHGEMPHGGGSGGYEQVSIPRAPRTPHFAPQMVSATGPYHAAAASSRVPAAAHSLSPVAMASARGAVQTGGYAAQDTQEVKARPSAKAGFSILFAGAIIGGLIGAVMHARETAADAITSAAQHSVDSVPTETPPPGFVPSIGGPVGGVIGGTLPSLIGDGKTADNKLSVGSGLAADDTKKKDTKIKVKWVGGGGKRVTTTNANAVDKDAQDAVAEKPEKPTKTKKVKGGEDDDGYKTASSGSDKDEAPAKPEKTEKTTKKSAAADKDADSDTAPTKKTTKKKGGDDAAALLKAAMGATENTL